MNPQTKLDIKSVSTGSHVDDVSLCSQHAHSKHIQEAHTHKHASSKHIQDTHTNHAFPSRSVSEHKGAGWHHKAVGDNIVCVLQKTSKRAGLVSADRSPPPLSNPGSMGRPSETCSCRGFRSLSWLRGFHVSQFIAPLCEESKDLLLLLFPNPEPPAVGEHKTFMGEGNHRMNKFRWCK